MPSHKLPNVLVFGGTDPTGGAGISADILSLASLGCHACPVITAVTAQNTTQVEQYQIVETELVIAQARAVLEDLPIKAIKTGMLANSQIIAAISTILDEYNDIPVIVDPVMASDGGDSLSDEPLEDAYRALLIPHTLLMTPNIYELKLLSKYADSINSSSQELQELGCEYLLVTGTHTNTENIYHRFFGDQQLLETYTVDRLPDRYHGSGCTLASACAAGIAHGIPIKEAVSHAINYTRETLENALRQGMGQKLPNRLYWADDERGTNKK